MNSRSKGKRGELEAAKEWSRLFGGEARRGQQFSGGKESPDVVSSHVDVHLEVKRCEVGNPYVWMEQAVGDAGDKIPVVLHRRNGKPWLLIARLEDAPGLAKTLAAPPEKVDGRPVPPYLPGQGVLPFSQADGEHPRDL
jgi:hypothetical protein